ncbi:hypothetical protein HOLleu_44190 [Holothuria leucospilota]|uniref:Uncharacterized protein n=1 Tax=Holothuria leucospilota TaxID=206669 RepID=A0A9Q1B8R5_HOLLE|nr:hypothetical protein HOLleu_44190 [Holothuria leucospilota]
MTFMTQLAAPRTALCKDAYLDVKLIQRFGKVSYLRNFIKRITSQYPPTYSAQSAEHVGGFEAYHWPICSRAYAPVF